MMVPMTLTTDSAPKGVTPLSRAIVPKHRPGTGVAALGWGRMGGRGLGPNSPDRAERSRSSVVAMT
jgi:hypothetical protein